MRRQAGSAMLTSWKQLAATCPVSMGGAQVQNRMILLAQVRGHLYWDITPTPAYSTAENNSQEGPTHSQCKLEYRVETAWVQILASPLTRQVLWTETPSALFPQLENGGGGDSVFLKGLLEN